jgi:hypothetical protein
MVKVRRVEGWVQVLAGLFGKIDALNLKDGEFFSVGR